MKLDWLKLMLKIGAHVWVSIFHARPISATGQMVSLLMTPATFRQRCKICTNVIQCVDTIISIITADESWSLMILACLSCAYHALPRFSTGHHWATVAAPNSEAKRCSRQKLYISPSWLRVHGPTNGQSLCQRPMAIKNGAETCWDLRYGSCHRLAFRLGAQKSHGSSRCCACKISMYIYRR